MNISRIMEGEIPQRYKDAGSALAKRLAAFDKETSQKAQATQKVQGAHGVQQIQVAQEARRVSFAEMLSKAQMAQSAKKAEPVSLVPGERAFEPLAASERLTARLVSGWK